MQAFSSNPHRIQPSLWGWQTQERFRIQFDRYMLHKNIELTTRVFSNVTGDSRLAYVSFAGNIASN